MLGGLGSAFGNAAHSQQEEYHRQQSSYRNLRAQQRERNYHNSKMVEELCKGPFLQKDSVELTFREELQKETDEWLE